jgi:PPOX class probable F420-dependent enzyme
MKEPRASRPHMPGYGVRGPGEGTGLLPWAWAEARLGASRNYWVVTSWPDGRPHTMPVWGLWDAGAFWFSTGGRSRKARNLAADPRCVVTTEDALNPVVVEGAARITREAAEIARFLGLLNAKYGTGIGADFLDPDVNATVQVRPRRAFGLLHDDFTGSPTRWEFDPPGASAQG